MGNPYRKVEWGSREERSEVLAEVYKGSERTEAPRAETNQYDPLTSILTSWMECKDWNRGRGKQIVDSGGEHRILWSFVFHVDVCFDHSCC